MKTVYVVPLSLKYEKMKEKKDCKMFPCEKKTKYRFVNFSEITFELNNGAGGSGTKMYLCYQCFQKHKNNVYEARKSGKKKVFYVFENWKKIKDLKLDN